MRTIHKSSVFGAIFVLIGIGLGLFYLFGPGFAINYSPSIPEGIYLIYDRPAHVGDYTFLTDSTILHFSHHRGYSAPHTFMGKKVVAGAGDTITINDRGIFINGVKLANSRPHRVDSKGRAMPSISKTVVLGEGQYVLYGHNPLSFDSRYFGIVDSSDIAKTLRLFIRF